MKTKLTALCLFVLVTFTGFSQAAAQQKHIDADNLDLFFKEQLKTHNLAALSAAIIKDDKIIWKNAYGLRNRETKEPVLPNTLYHQGSVSKTITAAALLQLLERKGISLDEGIKNYLSFAVHNPNHPDAPITFRMLLTHTSSLNDVNVSRGRNKLSVLNSGFDSPDMLGRVLKDILIKDGKYYDAKMFLDGEPGSEYAYSNLAFSLAGLLIEKISKMSFPDYVRKNIFNPLNMKKSTFLLSETDLENFAYQYRLDRQNPDKLLKVEPYTWAGYMDGSLRTTAEEYGNFLIMLINHGRFGGKQVLQEKTIDTMLQFQDLPGKQSARMFKPLGRALVWNCVQAGNLKLYQFNGYGSGFFTEVYFSKDRKIAGLFFITGEYADFQKMGRSIMAIMGALLKNTVQ